jgi:predicted xylose isomerase-like sugar epimerase
MPFTGQNFEKIVFDTIHKTVDGIDSFAPKTSELAF